MKRQAIDEAKKALDHWKRIASTGMRRDMDARAARDAEAKRIAEAKVAEEAATKAEREEAERKEREALNGVPDISVDTPADARARGYRRNGPQKVDRQQPIKAVTGKEVNIKFSDNAIPTGHVAVIEAEQLQPSHIQGNRNPAFFIDEAQPKNRKDESSVLSAKKIAENIRPEEITSSVTAYTGAPSVNARGEVIQGNNRSDALKLMWNSYPENGEAYKKYLADHADEFGIDAEELGKMQHPVLVNMIDADDKQAIELGQYVAQDTESGGVERIKAKNTVQKMGARIKNFASILLNGEEDESFAQLVDKNGAAVLKWLNKAGFISDTQVQSAIDRNGNVTAEATNDLKQMMYQSIFTDAPTRLEEMFGNLPVKAQKAVLATAFRDFDSNKDDRMTGEIQKSIIAYNSLISDSQFNNAKDEAEVRQAVEDWKRSYKFDDVSGESFLPSEEFSNFALELATMYRTKPQSHIQATFNEMYDIIQGAKKDTLFETADKTPKSLAAAIKQVLNINYDGNKRDLLLDSSAETGQEGQRGGDKDARIGEHAQEGEEPSERGEGTERNPITQKIGGSIFGDSSEFPETDLPNRVKQYLYDELPSCFRRAYFKTGFPKLGENNSEEILKGKVYDNFVKEAAESLPESTFDHVKEYLPTYFDYFYKKLDEAAAKKEDKSSVSSVDESKKEKEEKPSFIDAIHTIYTKGKELASKLFQRSFFVIADTPQFMKELGITGDKFTIKYGVIARHLNKDESHNLNEEEWSQLAEGLQHPFAISKVSNKDRGYRLYTTIKNKKGEYIVAGVDVKNAGRDIEVNAVSTVFGRRENANLTVVENVIYTDKNITPDQLALLDGPNFRQYPTDQELSTSGQQTLLNGPNSRQYSAEHEFSEDKGSEKTSDEQANSEKNDGYSIKSAEYTNKKGKKTDMYHLDFDSELTDKQKKALNAFAREKTGEGRFASSRGWADRENGGYYFRTEEDARKAAELIKDREAVEDAQPLSLDDIKEEPSKGNVQDEKNEADPSPTDAQKEAGNYRKGHRIVDGHKISIENEKGSTRSGVDADGTPWSVTMNNAYGYIRGTEGVDGDHIDVFLSDNPESGDVYVVDQVNPKTGEFDEHKVMYGFNSEDEAREAYLSNYSPGWKGLGNITRISREDFKEWIGSSRRKTKPFADYASVKKAEDGKDKKKSRWVDDEDAEEFARLRDILRKGLGNQLNSMFPANLIEPATKMSYLMMKHGVHKIQEYATAMIEELGEAIRPHIKSLYEFTRYTEEVQRSQWKDDLSSHEEVDAFDHIGFDSKKFGPVETAELITASQDSQAMMEAKERELKEKRNNIRKQKDEQRTADTEALAEQSEALASEAEDKLETIETAQDENAGNELAERIDRQIEAVNDQLALLGYYEADENGAFNESFGYMKTAEKKAVKDAEHLAMKLAADLGIDTGATKGKKKSKLAKADIAPAGGDITMRLPLNDGRELMVNIGLEPVSGRGGVRNETGSGLSNDNLEVTHVMYRVENPGAKDAFTRYGMNRWEEADVSYSKLLSGIRKEAGRYMPGAEANERKRSAEPGRQSENAIPQGASIEASNAERMKALEGEMADNENRQAEIEERLDNAGEEDELERDAMEGELAELQNKQKDLEAEYNGLKSMNEESEALEGFYDNVVDEDAVENLDADAAVQLAIVGVLNPALTDMKPTAAYKWLQDELKNVSDGKLRDLKREYMFKEDRDKLEDKVLDAVNAEVEHRLQDGENQRKYESSKADNTSKEQGKTADEQMREWAEQAERGETPFTVTPEVEEEIQAQRMAETPEAADERKKASKAKGRKKPGASSAEAKPVADLFGDLFEDNNGLTINNNENEKDELQPGTGESGRGRRQSVADESLGTRPGNETEGPDGRGVDRRSVGHPGNDEGGSERVSGSIESEKRLKPVAPAERMNTHNNRAERGTDYAPKGVDARIKANIAAIELMKRLTETGEAASPAQMAVLRKFSGWGGLGRAFDVHGVYDWNLRKLLGEEAYMDANMSRNSAYYTPAQVIDTMWDVVRAMGFKGGNVLEGSAGIGNILGLMPEDFSERSKIHAVEIDATTGGILSLLYPDAEVDVKGFEKTHVENGSVDLAITNVPFVTGLHVMDETGDKDLSKKFGDIHDFCIAKNVRKLREGGIGVFITSNGTLDNSTKLREWLTGEGGADVVGAFRLNNETFGGAAVTSDIIVVRKRVNGRASAHAIDVSTVTSERTAVMDTGETKRVKSKLEPIMKTVSMTYNKYFMEHPECMAGEMKFGFERGDTYRGGSKGLYPANGKDQTEMLAKWVEGFKNMDAEQPREADRTAEEVTYDDLGPGVKEGSMLIDSNGLLCVARRGKAVPMQSKRKDKKDTRTDEEMVKVFHKNKVKGHTRQECFKDYSKVKDALNAVLEYQASNEDDKGLKPLLDALNEAFDAFKNKYGNLHKNDQLAWLRNDMDYPSVLALETYEEVADKHGNKTARYGKTDIFTRRVVEKEQEPKPTNTKDGIIVSLYKYGRIDIPYLEETLGRNAEDIKRDIVDSGLGFEDPVSRDMVVSYEYLSGNVREKLRQAEESNKDGAYTNNVKALMKVIPDNIPAHLIDFTLGSSWVDAKLYEDFVKERTGVSVKFTAVGGTWFMKAPEYGIYSEDNRHAGVTSEQLHVTVYGHELMEAAIQNKTITVQKSHRNYDGTTETEVDKAATALCQSRIDEIRMDFKDWARAKMQGDEELSAKMEQRYNEQFNNSVPKSIPDEFIPEHFGGQAALVNGREFKLRPHQAKAAIRATTQPVMLAHEVGTGKTFTLITAAMEMRRLGTARKPMIVVQNATVGQFVESAKALYPTANVLTLDDGDHNELGRKNFYAKIKYNDWDMIVVPQSVFERIPDSEERQMKFVQEKIDEKIRVMNALAETDGGEKSSIYRQAKAELGKQQDELNALSAALEEKRGKKREKDEKKQAVAMQNAEVKAKEMLDREVDDVENFDDMGIDALLVDEAHEYKHLGFATAMQRGVKGVDPKYSKKSQGVFLKTQAVMEKKNGKNVVFATGTPISNTAAEIWTFMRYLMPADQMKEYGIYYFDDFVRNFGNIQQMLEFSTNGKFKENNRFSGYVNLPELVRIWSGVADTVLTREAGGVSDKIPEMEGGKAQDVFLPQTKALRSVMKFVRKRLDEFDKMSGKEKKENSHIPLTMYGIAKAAAVDARLVVDNAEDDPYSKTNEAVRQTLRSLEETKDYKGTVAIFADVYQNGSTGFNLYTDIRDKLIKEGVDPKEIVVMVSGMTMKKKLEIFDKVNRGEVRVILGSTSTLGTGVNIQERLHTLIHLDAPNRPMDYTQRNGRILRQGNIHKEMGKPVRILRFGVEDSLDVTAYQRLKTKGAIADSIMNGKKMMASSMENRSLEEDEDVFGDITAQLSGSEYAMLKNQAEKEVRKLDANYRQWQNDQTYIHNQIPKLQGQVKETEALKAEADKALDTLKKQYDAKKGITVNGTKYTDLESMDKFFKDVNQKVTEQMNEAKQRSDYQAERSIRVNVGGIDFDFKTTVKSRMADRSGQTTLTFSASHDVKYSCEALGLKDVPVSKGWLRNGLEDVLQNVVTGNDFKEKSEAFGSAIDRAKDDIEKLKAREGKTFEDADKLAEMRKRLSEYEELMKKEMAEKEAKYAQIDSEVKEADGVHEAVEEDEEDDQDTQKDNNKYRIREDEPPVRTGIGYKVFVLKDGKLYPPMVANEDREDTPTGVWLDGDTNEQLIVDKEGADQEQAGVEPWLRRYHVQAGGKGTQGGSGKLAYRPGWHLGEIPYALQFGRMNPVTGLRELFPKDFVWAEVEYADDVDYQKESDERMWYNKEGKRLSSPTHSMGGLNHMPWNGSYRYRTNPNPETDAWIITGAMRVNRILKPSEVDEIVEAAGREPQEREAGAVTDAMVERLNRGLMKRMDTSEAGKKQAALTLGRKLGVKVRIVDDAETLADEDKRKKERMRNAKGWFDTKSGEVVIVAGNNRSVQDVEQTVFHEIVGHRALREMIGEEKMDRFLDEVYSHAGKAVRERIAALAGKHGWNMREATEEYLAGLAEKGFEDFNAEEKSLWQKVRDFVARLLQGLKIPKSVTLNDNDLRYILWRGYQMQVERGALGEAENVVMKQRLGAGEFKFRDGETPESMEESVIKGAVALAQKHKDDVKLRDDAMRAIGGNMQKLRQAMALQKELDVNTAKGVGDLAKTLVANGWFEGATARDLNRLMTQVQQAVGKEDITQNVDAIMDLMTDNLLSQAQSDMAKLLKVKASRVNAQGVEVQGELDGDGKKLVDVLKAGLKMREREDLENAIEAASDRMGSEDDVTSEEAAIEYEGLCLAKRFMEDITDSKKELADLKKELKQAKEDFAAGKFADRAAYDEFVRSTEDAIRQNKLERMEAFRSLTGDLADRLRGSIARAKEFRAADKERVRSIQHNANSDMEGRPSDEHRRDTRAQKAMNSPVVRFFLKPLATFDQMLRLFGNKAQNGEGYLYNRFMRGWVDASEAERLGVRKSFETMDRKASRVFRRRMRWSDLYALERGMRKGYAVIRNGDGMQRVELTQGNMLYIYMANKMADGRMKLRKMGIKEEDVERITDIIDPRFTELADWMQEEFLVDKRSEYNEVYKRMFGTSMAAIENYFPLKILSNARSEKVDVGDGFDGESKPSTTTGSIIKRRRNGLALDVTGADAFSVLVEHIQNMEKWAAFAEFNRDVNTLLSYKRFRNQVMNMSSIYGGGKKLWNNFKDVCRIAAGTYHPVVGSDSVDSTFTNVSKGVTAAKISFRVFTALKQLLSSPAFVSEANPARLLADAATPWRAWNWAMKELPLFEKRWKSRQAGDSRLLPTEMDWRFWRNNLVEKLGQWGMSPNAFVDALTVAVGAHAIYRTKYGQYVREGYDAQWADRRAKQDATVLYNETQQSNENAFLSTMQLDRTVASVAFSVFRNSSMGYQRQMVDAIRNLKRAMTPGYRERSIAFMAKQHVRNGLESDQANAAATKDYNRGVFRDLTRLAVFGFVMQFAWNLGAYLPYLIGGGDDDDKDEFLKDAAVHALFGGVEGLTGGNLLSDGLNMAVSGQSLQNYDPSLLPLLNDVESIVRHFQSDQVAAANDVVNLLVQSGIGVNPQTLTDMAVAVWDACGGDARTQREATLCLMRVLSCPQSQLDKVYFDELGCNGTDASQLTPKELAERYAIYKVKRSAALTGWAYGNELKEKRLLTYEDKAKAMEKARLGKLGDRDVNALYLEYSEDAKQVEKMKEAIAAKGAYDAREAARLNAELARRPEYGRYRLFKRHDAMLDKLAKRWLAAGSAEEKAEIESRLLNEKERMVALLCDYDKPKIK
jgi:N12 class adenine-specific DNA methylase